MADIYRALHMCLNMLLFCLPQMYLTNHQQYLVICWHGLLRMKEQTNICRGANTYFYMKYIECMFLPPSSPPPFPSPVCGRSHPPKRVGALVYEEGVARKWGWGGGGCPHKNLMECITICEGLQMGGAPENSYLTNE